LLTNHGRIIAINEGPAPYGYVQLVIETGNDANYVWVNYDRDGRARASGRFQHATLVGQNVFSRTWLVNFSPYFWTEHDVEIAANHSNTGVGAHFHTFTLTFQAPQSPPHHVTAPSLPTPAPALAPAPAPAPNVAEVWFDWRYGNTFTVSGYVTYHHATVWIVNTNTNRIIDSQVADRFGFFEFWDIPNGRFRIEAELDGYSGRQNINVNNRDIRDIDIQMN
jgi:hypothetical protein